MTGTYRISKHVSVAISVFERMGDDVLSETFSGVSASEVRANLAELRSAGFAFYPCHCGNYDDKGQCKGVTTTAVPV